MLRPTDLPWGRPRRELLLLALVAALPTAGMIRPWTYTPRGTAIRTVRMMVESAIEIEGSTRWLIIFSTGTLEISDTPRSPCSSFAIQVKNWV